ncbi:MAG: glycosyltransferase family 2 protein [Pseudomonadota bacterium]
MVAEQGIELSLIVPVYNEEENLQALFNEIFVVMDALARPWEVIFVDDGSSDASLKVIHNLATQHSVVRYLSFAKNCGQSAAFGAGFRHACGQYCITMDADLQNDPADIPAMLGLLQSEDCQMVIGWRAKRQDTFAKRFASKIANTVRNAMSNETVKDTGCSLKIMQTDLARRLPTYIGMHRFLPTLMKMEGAKVTEIKVNHRARLHGTSKYGTFARAKTAFFDLLAVRWMQKRHVRVEIKEQK